MRRPGATSSAPTGGEPRWLDPLTAVELLADPPDQVVLLHSSDGSGMSHLGFGHEVVDHVPAVPLDPTRPGEPAWMGWLDYEGGARFLGVTRSIGFDHRTRSVVVRGDELWRAQVTAAIDDGAAGTTRDPAPSIPPTLARWRHDDHHYLDLIARCQAAIRRGDAYQLCLTNTATVDRSPDAWQVYRRLAALSPTHHAGFLRLGDTTLASASPESFLTLDADGVITSSPIKGTRARSADPVHDAALAVELAADEKERAENLMIVDLVRNDLSRIAELGTVRVARLLEVESYPQVHQLVSTVEASLRAGMTGADAIDSLFPAGSMTGAPKRSAMDLLRAFEEGPRGLYSGAFGLIGADGSIDLAMTIRSIVFRGGGATVGAGGGITALSVPERELAEVRIKAAPLLAALGAVSASE
ncbi:anthranilate synthase component I family protein [Amnibacterium flavum]|uniref:Metal ABC transporter ATP-binding protein n=1 Tax=Amnibacterium flavum TaxID=2173173 RepID=A0A2V1HP32_9MICO|nr:anthranilate synthase component I family protein [Amnibacterium flavum]PVZ94091.1 metal ABC transporter ATP-binding protein [Amnibacterium flavum]